MMTVPPGSDDKPKGASSPHGALRDGHAESRADTSDSVGSDRTRGAHPPRADDAATTSRLDITLDDAALRAAIDVCDAEPIHIPGGIQPHGYLLVLDAAQRIVQCSANVVALMPELGGDPTALLGRPIADVIGDDGARAVGAACASAQIAGQPLYVCRVAWAASSAAQVVSDAADGTASAARERRGERTLDVILHEHEGAVLVEIEPTDHVGNVFSPIYALVRTFIGRLQQADTIAALSDLAVREVRRITAFGRVVLYRFDDDGNGQVIAEDRAEKYPSFQGQHFPASDIPAQARALYLKHAIRLIVDADAAPSPLVPERHPQSGQATDLSYAMLRSVSPVHLQYMRNMGTASAMSISIIVRGRLWGLISCHHATPRHLNFEARAACEHLGAVLSLQMEAKEDRAETASRLELRRMLVDLIATMSDRDDFVDSLVSDPRTLLRYMSAGGVAVLYNGRTATEGATPDIETINAIVSYIGSQSTREVYATDAIGEQLPAALPFAGIASGVLAVQISRLHRHFVIWFRPEVIRTVEWAGNPHKGDTDASGALSPRTSFDSWKEVVRNRSIRWQPSELASVHEFRASVLSIVLRRAEEMAVIAAELGRANKELESFSYSVSHDLRAPLRHIVGYADLLKEYEGERLTERGTRFLKNIVDSARFAGTLVDDLLSFSQMGRAALRPVPVRLNTLVDTVIREVMLENPHREIAWDIGPLPTVIGDPAFLLLALRNLMSNAVKYTRPRAPAEISVTASESATEHIVSVVDNGVGFNMRYVGKLFGVFQRLHRAEEFEGTGIGLANVRRIIERHDGRTWAEGELERGARFHFALPKQTSTAVESTGPEGE
jgi:light-regulated signal transduction histidine kinase (bacteriophytochrome)